jgi:acetyl-CoA C-acetyltransferase
MSVDPRLPVIVGVAQLTEPSIDPAALTPLDLLERVARLALEDTGAASLPDDVDWLAVMRAVPDSTALPSPGWDYPNLAVSVARRLKWDPARLTYPEPSGNGPQWLVNLFAEAIAAGDADVCVLVGGEAGRSYARARRDGVPLDWSDHPDAPDPEVIGQGGLPTTKAEFKHGAFLAPTMYALYENALAAHYGRSQAEHRAAVGELMARFTEVAAANPYAVSRAVRSEEELVEATDDNRMVAWPYPKHLCANSAVDQAAALVMMSTEAADRLGVPAERRVHLHGCADTSETWFISDRPSYTGSRAIEVGAREALRHAGVGLDRIDLVDLYSCFPSAVQIAADAIGLAHDDPRGLTVTGGLPYFGGPGNNYSTHAIAEMVTRLRSAPAAYGLVHANGGFLTKHSFGVYSAQPPAVPFERRDPSAYQAEVDDQPRPAFDDAPSGSGTIETFTVVHAKGRPVRGIVLGRLDATGDRFIANVFDPVWLQALMDGPAVGRAVEVTSGNPVNHASLVGVRPASADLPDPVTFVVDGEVAIVTINRPEARNAINAAVAAGLEAAVRRVEDDSAIRVAILAAAGDRAFSAGVDLGEVSAGRGAEISRPGSGFAGFVQARRTKPWIAAVRGSALGGGLELCLACDLVVAAHDSQLGLPEVQRGLIAGAGGVIRLPRVVPQAVAYEMIATGIPVDGDRALQLGLVNRAVAADAVLDEALALARVIAANAPLSVTGSLTMARQANDLPEDELWRLNARIAKGVVSSEDAAEGPRAFLEKRKPVWKGR